jgi:hypothetical protein
MTSGLAALVLADDVSQSVEIIERRSDVEVGEHRDPRARCRCPRERRLLRER